MAAAGASGGDEEVKGTRSGIIPLAPAVVRGEPSKLGVSPDGTLLIYANKHSVIVRDVEDPSKVFVYGEHAAKVTVAAFSPNGNWVASGDEAGRVRVWSWTAASNALKHEVMALGGKVEDISWDGENKRILAVGGGAGTARVFMWDTGSQLGTLQKHDKTALSGAMKPTRPYRLAYGGADAKSGVTFCTGPPFKYNHAERGHDNFVNCVRFSPSGEHLVSVSSDKTGILYDGKEGTEVAKLTGHKGSVYATAWAPDSARLVTSSADKTLKFWSVPDGACTSTTTLGSGVGDMQNAVVWAGRDTVISASLSGALNWVEAGAEAPTKVVHGHVEAVTAHAYDSASNGIVTGDGSGRLLLWTPLDDAHSRYEAHLVTGGDGEGHGGRVTAVAALEGQFFSVGADKTLKVGSFSDKAVTASAPLAGHPLGVSVSAASGGHAVVVTADAVGVYKDGAEVASVEAPWGATCVHVGAAAEGGAVLVAVGGEDKFVHFFKLDASSGALTEDGTHGKALNTAVNTVAIAPDGATVAAGDATREVKLIDTAGERPNIVSGRWTKHSTRPLALAWNTAGTLLASVATDRRLAFWSPAKKIGAFQCRDLAHFVPFTGAVWAGTHDAVWTVGADGNLLKHEAPTV